jgi:MFS family permease
MWSAQTVSEFGDRITELALPLIAVLSLRATAADVGILTALVWLPNLGSLFIGSWVEHQPRKRIIMVAADLARAVIVLTIPAAWFLGVLALWQLYAVAVLAGLAHVAFNTAYSSFFVSLVPKAAFIEANSKLSTTRSVSFVAGPAAGGGLIQLLTAPYAVVVDAATFLVSAAFLGGIRVEEPTPPSSEGAGVWRRSLQGMGYVLRHPYIRASLAASTTVNFFTFISAALVILFASRTLGLSPGVIGLTFGVGAVGGVFGALVAPRLARIIGIGPEAIVGAVLFPLPIALVALADGPWLTKVILLGSAEFLSGMGVMFYDINLNSIQASVIPHEIRSRVAGAFSTVNYGIRPIGALVGGVLGSVIGLREALLVAAVGGATCVLWLIFSPIAKVRELENLAPVPLHTGITE